MVNLMRGRFNCVLRCFVIIRGFFRDSEIRLMRRFFCGNDNFIDKDLFVFSKGELCGVLVVLVLL